jgi:CheY-like chemotaxis protein
VYGGTGLGLALARRLAEKLGGTLNLLQSAPNQGSTFRLTLAGRPSEVESTHPPRRPSAPVARVLGGVRILLAEDHTDMQLAVRRLLEQAGASVAVANDGREAVAKASAAGFDVVLMDLRMPRMDGLQAARALRSKGSDVPIVALTADPATVQREEALLAGCNACVSKPFTLDELVTSIRLLGRRANPPPSPS